MVAPELGIAGSDDRHSRMRRAVRRALPVVLEGGKERGRERVMPAAHLIRIGDVLMSG
jgi:hypothetical protein